MLRIASDQVNLIKDETLWILQRGPAAWRDLQQPADQADEIGRPRQPVDLIRTGKL